METFFQFLENNQIAYKRHDHPAVYTVEEADQLVPELSAAKTKNLFLRDDKGKRHFLVVVPGHKQVNLKLLKDRMGVKRISFGSPERMKKHLGIEPGAVSIMALYHDKAHAVELFVDQELWKAESFQCHPLVNTATLEITRENLTRFLEITGHEMKTIEVPER
ncbi:MAG: prolyl-tRNA synthetase associated domain-containing protein [Desulfobacterales bacterium]|nr:prolyl-tRNA synthetase associated domain-containing protein [Desulfobacterales bacterium]MDX2510809.1 prolyl-tRNA synthetase associated domain-containing protein [Desulfobacterales bacterium]